MLSNLYFKLYSSVSLIGNSKKCPMFSMIIFEKKFWFYPCTTLCSGQETMFIFLLHKWELLTTESSHTQCCSVDVKHCCRNNSLRQKRKAPVFFLLSCEWLELKAQYWNWRRVGGDDWHYHFIHAENLILVLERKLCIYDLHKSGYDELKSTTKLFWWQYVWLITRAFRPKNIKLTGYCLTCFNGQDKCV